MYWSKLTTRGAMMGGWLGLITAVVLMILGPTIWVQDPWSAKKPHPEPIPLFLTTWRIPGDCFFPGTHYSTLDQPPEVL